MLRMYHERLLKSIPNHEPITDQLHLSSDAVVLLIATDFVDAFVGIHTASFLENLFQRGNVFTGIYWAN